MGSVNKVILLGNLGQDPEVKMTQGGQQVCTLNIATSDSWVKDGKREERTEWHRVVLWGRLADLAGKYLKKGRRVFLEGRLQTRSWEDQSGQKRYTTEIVATQMVFVDSAGGKNESYEAAPAEYSGPTNDSSVRPMGSDFAADEDVPF